jgi:hypothetical protein
MLIKETVSWILFRSILWEYFSFNHVNKNESSILIGRIHLYLNTYLSEKHIVLPSNHFFAISNVYTFLYTNISFDIKRFFWIYLYTFLETKSLRVYDTNTCFLNCFFKCSFSMTCEQTNELFLFIGQIKLIDKYLIFVRNILRWKTNFRRKVHKCIEFGYDTVV